MHDVPAVNEAKTTDAENSDAKNKDSAAGEGNEEDLAVEKKKEDKVDVLDAGFGKEEEQNDGIRKDGTDTNYNVEQ